jgi:hypothetical protein
MPRISGAESLLRIVDMADRKSTGKSDFFFDFFIELNSTESGQEVKRRRRVMLLSRRLVC